MSDKKKVGAPVDAGAGGGIDEAELGALVRKSCAGDEGAWQALWPALERVVDKAAGQFRVMSRLSRSEDERRWVVVHVMEHLRRDGFRQLAELGVLIEQRDGAWRRWLSAIAANAARNHKRGHADYLGLVDGGGARWASYAELSEEQEDERPDPVRHAEAHIILARAREELSPAQYGALLPWLEQASYAEIARAQGLAGGADEARRLVQSAVERLRYQFAEERGCLPGARRPGPRRRARPQ